MVPHCHLFLVAYLFLIAISHVGWKTSRAALIDSYCLKCLLLPLVLDEVIVRGLGQGTWFACNQIQTSVTPQTAGDA